MARAGNGNPNDLPGQETGVVSGPPDARRFKAGRGRQTAQRARPDWRSPVSLTGKAAADGIEAPAGFVPARRDLARAGQKS